MKPGSNWVRAEWAVIAVAGIRSSSLYTAWRDAPLERLSWLVLLLWMFPIFYGFRRHAVGSQSWAFVVSVGLTLAGTVGSLNVLCHVGLAVALSGLVRPSPAYWPWLITAVAWMPLFSWATYDLPPIAITFSRFLGTAAAAAFACSRIGDSKARTL